MIEGHIPQLRNDSGGTGVVTWFRRGGGAVPYPVERTPADDYQDLHFPNYQLFKNVFWAGENLEGDDVSACQSGTFHGGKFKDTSTSMAPKTK